MIEPTNKTITVVYKKDMDIIPSVAPSYIITKVNFKEQLLIKKIKELYNKGISKKEIIKLTKLNRHLVNEYLKKPFYFNINSDIDYFNISSLPSTYLNHLEELNDYLCYDFDSLDKFSQNLFDDICIKYELQDNGLYTLGDRIYKIKRKTTKQV